MAEEKQVSVMVEKNNEAQAQVEIKVDGEVSQFNLPEMNVGETQSVTDASGNNVIIEKTEAGYKVKVAGEVIEIPSDENALSAHIHQSLALQGAEPQVVISGVELDESQQQIIRDAFKAAGVDKPVVFSALNVFVLHEDTGDGDGKQIKVLRWHSDNDEEIELEDGEKHIRKKIIIERK